MWFNTIHDIHEWVSEWLLFNALKSNFSTISWREQVTFQWDDNVLYKSKKLSWIFIVLAHWKKQSVWKSVVPVGHITLIPSQPVSALPSKCWMLSREASNTNLYFFVWPMNYCTWDKQTNHYTTNVCFTIEELIIISNNTIIVCNVCNVNK